MSDPVKLRLLVTSRADMQTMMATRENQGRVLAAVDWGCSPDPSNADGPYEAEMHLSWVAWPRPIPVSERLPEVGVGVLWYSQEQNDWEEGELTGSTLDGKKWVKPYSHYDIIHLDGYTHWLPLPPSPEAK